MNRLLYEPYGMRAGVIPVYLSYVLSKRKEDIVVYFIKQEIHMTADIVINMCEMPEDYWLFVSKENVQKEQYIEKLQKLFHVDQNYNLSDSRIKDILTCMQRWFRGLPQLTRNSSKYVSFLESEEFIPYFQKLKSLLQKADVNPYEILFIKVPAIFEAVNSLDKVVDKICFCKNMLDDYYNMVIQRAIDVTYDVFDKKRKGDLFHAIKEWHVRQSEMSKRGLYSGRLNNFMTCIERIDIYDDAEIVKKLAKSSMDIYLENWDDDSLEEYRETLEMLKEEAESIQSYSNEDKLKLLFTGKNGKEIERFYDQVGEGTGSMFRNILEDTLEEFDDLSVNDRVAILLEMIEKIIE